VLQRLRLFRRIQPPASDEASALYEIIGCIAFQKRGDFRNRIRMHRPEKPALLNKAESTRIPERSKGRHNKKTPTECII
jgi:hypothetical protein